MVIKDSH